MSRHFRFSLSLLALGLWSSAALAETADDGKPDPSKPSDRPAPKSVNLLLNDPRLMPRDTTMSLADWGAIRRAASTRFRPSREQITDESKPKVLARQLVSASPPPPDPAGRKISTDDHVEAQDAVDASRSAYERKVSQRSVEITVHTGATGQIESIQVTLPSGSPRFDEEAMLCLRDAFAAYPPIEERRPFVSRWRVRGGYGVALPRTLAPMTPRVSNGRMPARGIPIPVPLWGTFDETKGVGKTNYAFSDQIESQVELISHTPL